MVLKQWGPGQEVAREELHFRLGEALNVAETGDSPSGDDTDDSDGPESTEILSASEVEMEDSETYVSDEDHTETTCTSQCFEMV